MRRWKRTIKEQLNILELHTNELVDKLTTIGIRVKKLLAKQNSKPTEIRELLINKLDKQIFDIVKELKPVADTVLMQWPQFKPLFDGIPEDSTFSEE